MTTITTSIFGSGIHIAVNPVNTVGVMGAGLALEFKQRYPKMYQAIAVLLQLHLFAYLV